MTPEELRRATRAAATHAITTRYAGRPVGQRGYQGGSSVYREPAHAPYFAMADPFVSPFVTPPPAPAMNPWTSLAPAAPVGVEAPAAAPTAPGVPAPAPIAPAVPQRQPIGVPSFQPTNPLTRSSAPIPAPRGGVSKYM